MTKIRVMSDLHLEFGPMRLEPCVICNPRGYHPDKLNPEFNVDLVVIVYRGDRMGFWRCFKCGRISPTLLLWCPHCGAPQS